VPLEHTTHIRRDGVEVRLAMVRAQFSRAGELGGGCVPRVRYEIVTHEEERENHRAFLQFCAHEFCKATMLRLLHDHPELMQAHIELAARDRAKKRKGAESEAGPSTVIVSSDSEMDLDF
jgi:hypothetical protein